MSTDPSFALFAVSALDGRYASAVAPLAPFFSEWALIKYRVVVEVEWLRTLSREASILEVRALTVLDLDRCNDADHQRSPLLMCDDP